MKRKLTISIGILLITVFVHSQVVETKVFEMLDLNRPGLEKVKGWHEAGKDDRAAIALLDYFRTRTKVKHPSVNLSKVTISSGEQKWADDAMGHSFFVLKGYQPSFNYGKDINWEFWPVKDDELRWQLHRTKWWIPMGKAYRVSGDEKYAKEWFFQYMDWIIKNPLLILSDDKKLKLSKADSATVDNMRYAWRALEVTDRLESQIPLFAYFISSANFTPEFLTQFLVNYHRHAEYVMDHYSREGNHLLSEAERVLSAGAFFPEFNDAQEWRKSGMAILNKQINVQVYDDGFQNELDFGYHLITLASFVNGFEIALLNGFEKEFPMTYLNTIHKMGIAVMNVAYPNYHLPCFSDGRLEATSDMIRIFKRLSKLFPDDQQFAYMATEGKKGELPSYLSNGFKTAGFYIFRDGWKADATIMVVKAGPPATWHNQPDNGTFELYIKGRNFFPDAGSYIYGGDAEVWKQRNWFRQTMVHKTLTLNNANIKTMDSKCLLWNVDGNIEKLVVENQSYTDLKHRRTVFFVNKSFFVIVDEAIGTATGNVGIHYQLIEGLVNTLKTTNQVSTLFEDGNNVVVQAFGAQEMKLVKEEGWVSYELYKKIKRSAFAFESQKKSDKQVRFITVICPTPKSIPTISAKFVDNVVKEKSVNVTLQIDKKNYELNANW